MRVVEAEETPRLPGEYVRETHRVVERTQTHPPGNQHHKGPMCLWVAEEVTESWLRAEQVAVFPLRPLPNIQHHNTETAFSWPWQIPKVPPLTAPDKKQLSK